MQAVRVAHDDVEAILGDVSEAVDAPQYRVSQKSMATDSVAHVELQRRERRGYGMRRRLCAAAWPRSASVRPRTRTHL